MKRLPPACHLLFLAPRQSSCHLVYQPVERPRGKNRGQLLVSSQEGTEALMELNPANSKASEHRPTQLNLQMRPQPWASTLITEAMS